MAEVLRGSLKGDTSRTALIAGATGLVGGHVLDLLLEEPRYTKVTALVRKPTGRTHERLTERVVEFDHLETSRDAFACTDVFACLGTTIKIAGSQARFRQVDHDYPLAVAKLAKAEGATRLALVSSIGADAKAGSFYLRVKGDTEDDLRALGFSRFVIAQPSVLLGERKESRPGEGAATVALKVLDFAMVGGLGKYRAIRAADVARGLLRAMLEGEGESVLRHAELVG